MTLFIIGVIAAFGILILGIYVRKAPKSLYFSYLALAIFIFTLGHLFEIVADSYQTAVVSVQIQYLGMPFIAPFLFLFTCEYCGIEFKKPKILLFFIIPVISCLMVLTWPLNGIYYTSFDLVTDDVVSYIEITGSVYYYIAVLYTMILVVITNIILIYHIRIKDKIFRRQALVIILAAIMPLLSTFSNVFHLTPFDLTTIFLSITCLFMGYSNFRLGLYRIGPVAREHIFEHMNDGFILIDMHDRFIDANSAAKRLFPELAELEIGVIIRDIEDLSWLAGDERRLKKDISITEPNGVLKHFQITESMIKYDKKTICRCIMLYDITDVKRLLDEISFRAERDTLTGLYNRGTFNDSSAVHLSRIAAVGGDACLIIMDLDHFKNVNDTYGHLKGDEVLRTIANEITTCFRSNDLVARYGGEEFIAFLLNVSEHVAVRISAKLREQVEKIVFTAEDGSVFNVTISIGIAMYIPGRHKTLDNITLDADDALYAAKNGGRNTIFIAKPSAENANEIVMERAVY
jgi:diguanylate cyclase (GGDEF)-like protein